MSYPPAIREKERTTDEWQRKARDLVNMIRTRLMGVGASTDRPPNPTDGTHYYDDDLKRPVWWNTVDGKWYGAEGPGQVVTPTANYTVTDTVASVINNKSGSSMTLTLPAASSYPGRLIEVKTLQAKTVVSASSNVAPIASATLGTAILPATAGAWAILRSDGAGWVVMARGT